MAVELPCTLRSIRVVWSVRREDCVNILNTARELSSMSDTTRLQAMTDRSTFHQLFQPSVLKADAEALKLSVKGHMRSTLERQPGTGQWHGGAASPLADTLGCYALALLWGGTLPKVNLRTDYSRLGVETDLVVQAVVRRARSTIGVVYLDVLDSETRLVAAGRATYSTHGDWAA